MRMERFLDLNPEQQTAVKCTEGPILVLAGGGTGKTRVITMRIAYLLHQGAAADSILAVTFTNKAANEMRARVSQLVDKAEAKKITICTFHALCVRILRQDIDRLGYKSNFAIYDEGDQLGLIRKIIARISTKNEKLDPNLAKILISEAKNEHWKFKEPAGESSLPAAVFHRYQEDLKAANAVDFDDLLILTVRLFEQHPDVAQKWQGRYRYIMVDEFQDTNRLQLELILYLGKNHQNVCVVGDDDQSIYGWRGAEVSNILEFEAHFPNPAIVKLEQNYRSTNAILNPANALIKNNPRRRPKQLWSAAGDRAMVRVVQISDDRQEAEFIANEIAQRAVTQCSKHDEFA